MKTLVFILVLGSAFLGCSHPTGPSSGNAKPGTAAARLSNVDALAKSINSRLQLKLVKGDGVMPDGFSRVWHYAYGDTASNTGSYWFHADSKGIGFDSISGMQLGVGLVTHEWCNSDSAMRIAERDGGAEFREENSASTVSAVLGELAVPERITRWWINYRSYRNSKGLMFAIDASTGNLILTGP